MDGIRAGGGAARCPVHPAGTPGPGVLRGRRDHRGARVRRGRGRAATRTGHLGLDRSARSSAWRWSWPRSASPAGSAGCTAGCSGSRPASRSAPPRRSGPAPGCSAGLTGGCATGTAGGPSGTPGSSCRSRWPRDTPSSRWRSAFADAAYPLIWALFRHHPAGTKIGPLNAVAPVPLGHWTIETWPGTWSAALVGVVCVVAGRVAGARHRRRRRAGGAPPARPQPGQRAGADQGDRGRGHRRRAPPGRARPA